MKKTVSTGLAIIALTLMTACSSEQNVTYSTAKVSKQNISTSITATGTIEPVTKVEVGTQVSGIIDKIYVDYNSVVKKGQVIAELDKTNLVSELNSAQSNLANAQSNLTYQKANYNRYKNLYDKGLIAANDFENARLSYEQAVQQVKIQQQSVEKARTNLGYATITSPIDGVVISKEVEVGQTVASSFSTPTLFTIARDLKDMQVVADVDEADIGEVREGQRVSFTVDAFPDDTFSGVVKQVRQNATTTNNVVTYEVVITAPNQDLKLKPGLTANVTIYTLERSGVTSVPSKALRFTPETAIIGKGYKVKDVNAEHKLWTLEGNTFVAHKVEIGITDGTRTQITSGVDLNTNVVLDVASSSLTGGGEAAEQSDDQSGDSEEKSPFAPQGPGNKNKKNSSNSGSK